MRVFKSILMIFSFLVGFNSFAMNTVPQNTYLFYERTGKSGEIINTTSLQPDFFKRLLTYVDKAGNSQDAFMDGFVFMDSVYYFGKAGNYPECINNVCTLSAISTEYIENHFGSGGHLDRLRTAEKDAVKNVSNYALKVPQIGVYFTIPYPHKQAILNPDNIYSYKFDANYMKAVKNYLEEISQGFNQWNSRNPDSSITMKGFYFARETIQTLGGHYMFPGDVPYRYGQDSGQSFLFNLKKTLREVSPAYTLVSSPFQNFRRVQKVNEPEELHLNTAYGIRVDSLFAGNVTGGNVFDKIWVQPNIFYGDEKWADVVDKEVFRWMHSYYRGYEHMAYNIETTDAMHINAIGKEFFPQVVNYIDYAKYLGVNNYPITYYDEGQAYYNYSIDTERHWVYQETYKLAKRGRDGDIVNGSFEHFDLVKPKFGATETDLSAFNPEQLLGWQGTFNIANDTKKNITTYSWITDNGAKPILGDFYLKPDHAYQLSFKVEENYNAGVAWPGIAIWRFYDVAGNQIKTGSAGSPYIKFSSHVNGWYQYVDPKTTNQHDSLPFSPPSGTVKTEVILGKWGGNSILNWSNVSIKDATNNNSLYVIGKSDDGSFTYDNFQLSQQHANLSKSKYIESKDAFNIVAGLTYKINFQSQQKSWGSCSGYNGVLGMKFYDENGVVVSNPAAGLNWSSYLGMHYNYFISPSYIQNHAHGFTAPTNAKSAKVSLRNWSCAGNIMIDNVKLQEIENPILAQSFTGEAVALDQDKLIRLNDINPQARFTFDLTTGNYKNLTLLSRTNCTNMKNETCSGTLNVQYLYLDADGNVISTLSPNQVKVLGKGESYTDDPSGNRSMIYSHWEIISTPINTVTGSKKLNVIFSLSSLSSAKELLLNRPHLN